MRRRAHHRARAARLRRDCVRQEYDDLAAPRGGDLRRAAAKVRAEQRRQPTCPRADRPGVRGWRRGRCGGGEQLERIAALSGAEIQEAAQKTWMLGAT